MGAQRRAAVEPEGAARLVDAQPPGVARHVLVSRAGGVGPRVSRHLGAHVGTEVGSAREDAPGVGERIRIARQCTAVAHPGGEVVGFVGIGRVDAVRPVEAVVGFARRVRQARARRGSRIDQPQVERFPRPAAEEQGGRRTAVACADDGDRSHLPVTRGARGAPHLVLRASMPAGPRMVQPCRPDGARSPAGLPASDFPLAGDGAVADLFPWRRVQGDRNLHGPTSIVIPGGQQFQALEQGPAGSASAMGRGLRDAKAPIRTHQGVIAAGRRAAAGRDPGLDPGLMPDTARSRQRRCSAGAARTPRPTPAGATP